MKKHAVEFMESVGSFEKTKRWRRSRATSRPLSRLGGHDRLVKLVEKLDAQVAESSPNRCPWSRGGGDLLGRVRAVVSSMASRWRVFCPPAGHLVG